MIDQMKIVLLIVLTMLAGCSYPSFKHPLVHPDKARQYKELHGTFKSEGQKDESLWLHIGAAGEKFPKGFHRLVAVSTESDDGVDVSDLFGFFEKVDDAFILNIPLAASENLDSQSKDFADGWNQELVKSYLVAKLEKTESGITIALLNEDFIESKIKSKELAGRIVRRNEQAKSETEVETSGMKTVLVDATSEQLRRFFKEAPDEKLFEKPLIVFKKQE